MILVVQILFMVQCTINLPVNNRYCSGRAVSVKSGTAQNCHVSKAEDISWENPIISFL